MKLKCRPEDFRVEEHISLRPERSGPFALYRLTKRSLGTLEAIEQVARRWNLAGWQVSHAGLKDRHAETVQWLSIRGGPPRGLRETHWELEYVGACGQPVAPAHIVANRFVVVLRDLATGDLAPLIDALAAAARHGVANYFDNQRFGSLGPSGEFIAQPWCRGDYERALWLALAEPNVHDRPDERDAKQTLRDLWGRWPECKAALPRSSRRSVITLLADRPGDFKRAFALIRQELRSLYLAAFQSAIWNELLAATIARHTRPEQRRTVRIAGRDVPLALEFDPPAAAELAEATLPLPSARLHLEPGPLRDEIEAAVGRFGLALREVRVKYPRDAFFSRGDRRCLVRPAELSHAVADDELYPGRQQWTLRFELPRGCYATLLVKQVTARDTLDADDE